MAEPNDPVPPGTDEFNVKPLPTMKLSREGAGKLFKILNARPMTGDDVAILVANEQGYASKVLLGDALYCLAD